MPRRPGTRAAADTLVLLLDDAVEEPDADRWATAIPAIGGAGRAMRSSWFRISSAAALSSAVDTTRGRSGLSGAALSKAVDFSSLLPREAKSGI